MFPKRNREIKLHKVNTEFKKGIHSINQMNGEQV